jgi:hypothetical protein
LLVSLRTATFAITDGTTINSTANKYTCILVLVVLRYGHVAVRSAGCALPEPMDLREQMNA